MNRGSVAAVVSATAVLLGSSCATTPPAGANRDDAPMFHQVDLATAGEGAHTWRIPALEVLPEGTLIAAYDRRNDSAADLPGNIDVVVRFSNDQGRTWSAPQVVVDYDDGVGAGDPSLIVDRKTGRIFLFHAYAPPGVGFRSSGPGNADDSRTTLHADYSYSDNGGRTWQRRRITSAIKSPDWLGMFASSGTGIQLKNGRLLQQYAFRRADDSIWAVSAYSDDDGRSWRAGKPVGPLMDENKTVELADGRVMLNSRTASVKARLVAYSTDAGVTYSQPEVDEELVDPTNNAAILRYDANAPANNPRSHVLLFSNTASAAARERLTVRFSCDDGASWPGARVIEPGPAAYSTMVRLPDGTFGILYERANYRHITFARFNDAWLGVNCVGK